MNTLILNLTRFGDLLQTQPVVAGLKARGRGVGLVCLENFSEAAQLLEEADEVFPFPGAALLSELERNWSFALNRLHSWRSLVRDAREFATVLNLTPTQAARLLARIAARDGTGGAIMGFGLDDQGFGFYGNAWTAFLQMSSAHRGCSPFNLVDVMQRSAGLPVAAQPLALKRPHADVVAQNLSMIQDQSPRDCKGFAAFQLGASEPRRQWPEAYFAQLGDLLWNHLRLCPVLLGSQSERSLAENYTQHTGAPCIDLVGLTSLSELAATLCHVRILVTNDTGTMHLAAGLNCPVVALFLATAQPWDTGPYQDGCLCLEPNLECHPCSFGQVCPVDEACRWEISADLVFDLILCHWFSEKPATNPPRSFPSRTRVWRTAWDGAGYADLSALSNQEDSFRTQWIRVQRHYYRQFLDQNPAILPPSADFLLSAEKSQEIIASLKKSLALLELLQHQARVLAYAPLGKVKQKFLAYWERLQAHWQEDPNFTVLGRLWLVESQESGQDVSGILALTSRYADLVRGWMTMFQEKQQPRHEN